MIIVYKMTLSCKADIIELVDKNCLYLAIKFYNEQMVGGNLYYTFKLFETAQYITIYYFRKNDNESEKQFMKRIIES